VNTIEFETELNKYLASGLITKEDAILLTSLYSKIYQQVIQPLEQSIKNVWEAEPIADASVIKFLGSLLSITPNQRLRYITGQGYIYRNSSNTAVLYEPYLIRQGYFTVDDVVFKVAPFQIPYTTTDRINVSFSSKLEALPSPSSFSTVEYNILSESAEELEYLQQYPVVIKATSFDSHEVELTATTFMKLLTEAIKNNRILTAEELKTVLEHKLGIIAYFNA